MNPFYYRAFRYSWNEDRYRTPAVTGAKAVPKIGADSAVRESQAFSALEPLEGKATDAGQNKAPPTKARNTFFPRTPNSPSDASPQPFHVSGTWDAKMALRALGPPKILVALDRWALNMDILSAAETMAKAYQAQLVLVHAIPSPEARKEDEEIRRWLERSKTPYEFHSYADDRPASVLLREAERQHASLLILATHGRTGKKRVLEGSVAEEALKQAPFPVLIHRPGTAWPRLKKILIPFDERAGAWPAAAPAVKLSRHLGADIWLLHVQEAAPIPSAHETIPWLSGMPKKHAEIRQVEAQGDVPESIAVFAEQEKIDLLVMPSRREDLSKKILPSGVTAQVARAVNCSVLVVPQ